MGSVAKERASRALSGGRKRNTRRRKQVKAGIVGKEGNTIDDVDRNEDNTGMDSLKQKVEQDDEAYNKMSTGTAVVTPKEAGTKETVVGRLDKDKNNE